MKISELKPKQGSIELTAEVVEVGEARTFNKFGKEGKVADAVIKDGSGQIRLSLWNEQADRVKAGDTINIKNGYVNEWQGELQLTTGRLGTIEVVPARTSAVDGAPKDSEVAPRAEHAEEAKKGKEDEPGIDVEEEELGE